MAEVLQLLEQYAFPIVFSLLLAWYVKYVTDKNREDLKEINKLHKEESDKFADALNNNTLVLQKLLSRIGGNDESQ